jgi:hypothetical protein
MSTTRLDERLARLAPTTPPDPERFESARAEVMRAVTAAPRSGGSGSQVSDDDRIRVDVVVPLEVARRARARRNRSIAVAAASIGVVG